MTGQQHKKGATRAEELAPRVAELVEQGHGRNEIARRLYVSPGTVTTAARIAGVTFANAVDTRTTERAAEVRQVSTAERHEVLAKGWAAVASRAISRLVKALDAETIEPSRLVTVAGIATDKLLKLEPPNDPKAESMEQGKQALADLHDAIMHAAASLATPEEFAQIPGETGPDNGESPRLRDGGDFY